MDVSAIVARLKAQTTVFRQIAGAAELAAVLAGGLVAAPAAFVLPLAESAEPNLLLRATRQRIVQGFAVVICVQNLQDARGGAALATLAPLRLLVRSALAAYVPDATTGEPIQITGGRLLKMDNVQLFWSDEFSLTTYYLGPGA
jgi:hypothetical protein